MAALLGNHPVLQDQDPVRLQDGGQAVGDDDAGSALHQGFQCLLNRVFGDGVQRRGCLVQNQDLRVLQDDAGNAQALFFAAGELQAPVSHQGFVSLRLRGDEVVQVGDEAGRVQFLLRGILFGIEQVLADAAVEEIAVLRHHADAGAQIGKVKVAHVGPGDFHAAPKHVIQARNQIHDRRLARAAGPDDGVHLPGRHRKVDILQQRLFGVIAEGDMIIDDIAVRDVRLFSVLGRDNRIFHVKVVKDAGKQSQRPGEVHMDVQERLHRPVEPVDQRDRRRDGADGQPGICVPDDDPSAGKVDQQRSQLGKQAHHHPEPAAALLLFQVQAGDLFVDLDKALVFALLAGKELHQQGTGDRQGLVDELVHLIALRLAVLQQLIALFPDPLRRQDQQRQHHNAHQRQLPAHRKQSHQCRDHRRDV